MLLSFGVASDVPKAVAMLWASVEFFHQGITPAIGWKRKFTNVAVVAHRKGDHVVLNAIHCHHKGFGLTGGKRP